MLNAPHIRFIKVGNQSLRTAVWKGTDKGTGKRTPLLFFNGIGANLEIAQAFADKFTGRDIITALAARPTRPSRTARGGWPKQPRKYYWKTATTKLMFSA